MYNSCTSRCIFQYPRLFDLLCLLMQKQVFTPNTNRSEFPSIYTSLWCEKPDFCLIQSGLVVTEKKQFRFVSISEFESRPFPTATFSSWETLSLGLRQWEPEIGQLSRFQVEGETQVSFMLHALICPQNRFDCSLSQAFPFTFHRLGKTAVLSCQD